jgi:hypothetical protein
MPTHQRNTFCNEKFEGANLIDPLAFLRGFPVLKLPTGRAKKKGQGAKVEDSDAVLYDLRTDA